MQARAVQRLRAPGRRPSPREPPGRTRTAGKPQPHPGRRLAIPTRRHAAEPAPASPGKANGVRKPSARPTPVAPCSLVLMVGSHRSPWLACSSRSSRTLGKIPLRQESAGPALVPRRQAGACTRGRKPRQTQGCTQGAHAGPAPVAPLQAASLAGAALVRFAERATSCDPRVSQVCGRLCGLNWPPHPQ